MLEWNMFVKPVLYVVELIFGSVVTFGTADKMLLLADGGGVRCSLSHRESPYLGPCIAPIIFGSVALLLLLFTLWRRLIAAFDETNTTYYYYSDKDNSYGSRFTNGFEATLCLIVAFIWFIVAALLSHHTKISKDDRLIGEKIVHLVFAWLLLVFCIISAAIAWLVPEHDSNILNLTINTATTTMPPYSAQGDDTTITNSLYVAQPPSLASVDENTDNNININNSASSTTAQATLSTARDPTISVTAHPSSLSLPVSEGKDASVSTALQRLNAARPLSSSAPDTKCINDKLNEWDRVIEGPPRNDPHADALGSASRIPVTFHTATTTATAAATAPSILRRRTAASRITNTNSKNDEDAIMPDLSKIQ